MPGGRRPRCGTATFGRKRVRAPRPRRPHGAWWWRVAPLGRAYRRSRARRRGGRGVLELLLGAEQRVEHPLAQALAQSECNTGTDDQEQQLPAHAALALLLAAAKRIGSFLQRRRRGLKLLLRLLVVKD